MQPATSRPHGFLLGKVELGGSGDSQVGRGWSHTEESKEARFLAWRPGGWSDTKETGGRRVFR